MRRWITQHTGPQGSGMVSVMFSEDTQDIAVQSNALGEFWRAINVARSNQYQWAVSQQVDLIDELTGILIGSETFPVAQSGTGSASAQPCGDALQALIQWDTSSILNGRRFKGRTYVPGIVASSVQNGNLLPGARDDLADAAQALCTAGQGFGVWHRPKASGDGVFAVATLGTCWSEFAVQRRRRR